MDGSTGTMHLQGINILVPNLGSIFHCKWNIAFSVTALNLLDFNLCILKHSSKKDGHKFYKIAKGQGI